jgi:hypothetical protein
MRGAILPLPQYVFVAWCLVKHRNNFTLTFTLLAILRETRGSCGVWPKCELGSFRIQAAHQTTELPSIHVCIAIMTFSSSYRTVFGGVVHAIRCTKNTAVKRKAKMERSWSLCMTFASGKT